VDRITTVTDYLVIVLSAGRRWTTTLTHSASEALRVYQDAKSTGLDWHILDVTSGQTLTSTALRKEADRDRDRVLNAWRDPNPYA
jgi:hypothetical protein